MEYRGYKLAAASRHALINWANYSRRSSATIKGLNISMRWKYPELIEHDKPYQPNTLSLLIRDADPLPDGRLAVSVQSDYDNFKKGPNIGATGGSQGFFYTV